MFKLEFPAENKPLAAAIGHALVEYGRGVAASATDREIMDAYSGAPSEAEPTLDEAAIADLQDNNETADTSHIDDKTPAAEARLDQHGVPFDADYCAKASDPFYKTGKTAGQWKKKKGVDQDEYDDWYAAAKPKGIVGEERTDAANPEIDTTAAFSDQTAGQQQAAGEASNVPVDAGGLMVWVSEMQTAGHFTQADVTQAYATAGISAPDIFQGANVAQNIASLYGILSAKVPA